MPSDLKVDIALVRRFGESRRSREENGQVKQLCRSITTKLISGNNSTAIREFDGLQTRLTGVNIQENSTASGGNSSTVRCGFVQIGVAIVPGSTIETWTPNGATSRRSTSAIASSANFDMA